MRERPWKLIQWKQAPRSKFVDAVSSVGTLAATAELYSPFVKDASPQQEAEILLCAAAEIEHALLVEYLYAAWSLGPDAGDLQSAITTVAVQEMCHLITVQNLLLALGAKPYFGRQDDIPHPDLDPFPFHLRPFRKHPVLEEFLLAEMPPLDQMDEDQQKLMRPIVDAHKLDPRFHRVAMIYARLFWLFQQSDKPTDPWPQIAGLHFAPGFHIDSFSSFGSANTFQADRALEMRAWHAGYRRGGVFEVIDSREAALQVLHDIAAQGEGLAASNNSHFEVFFGILTGFDQVPASGFLSVPTDPTISDTACAKPDTELNRITNKLAVALCDVFDVRYRIMLACLRTALSRDRSNVTDAPVRTKYIQWALEEMQSAIRPLAGTITSLPRKNDGNTKLLAGPMFRLGGLDLPDDPVSLDLKVKQLYLEGAKAIAAALNIPPDRITAQTLQDMLDRDNQRFRE